MALTTDGSGNFYLASSVSSLKPIDVDGHSVKSTGDADLLLAKLDAKGRVQWAAGYGDPAANPQVGIGAAATKDGTLAVIGNFSGSMRFGGSTIESASQIDFLAGIRTDDGKAKWAKRFDNGANGRLAAVAANPASPANRIAVCGWAVQPASDLAPGARYGGGNDIVIAMFDSQGTKLWSAQIGVAGNEQCDALAIDDRGDLFAAGRFDGATLSFGKLPALTGPANANRKFVWVAKLDGATGEPRQAVAFSGAAGFAWPTGVAVDAAGKLLMAGQFTSSLVLGKTRLTGAGARDAFVAKLDPEAGLAPTWSTRLGGTGADGANGVAVTSSGEVLVTGFFNRKTTGAASLTASGATAPDVFLLILDGGSGATLFARSYGDALMQSGDAIAVDRFGGDQIALAGTLTGSMSFSAPAGTIKSGAGPELFFVAGGLERSRGN